MRATCRLRVISCIPTILTHIHPSIPIYNSDLNARVAEWARLSSTAPPLLASATAKPYAPVCV